MLSSARRPGKRWYSVVSFVLVFLLVLVLRSSCSPWVSRDPEPWNTPAGRRASSSLVFTHSSAKRWGLARYKADAVGQEIASTPSPTRPEPLSPLSPPSEGLSPSRESPNFLPSVAASFLVNESKSRVGMSELLWTQCIYLASYTTKPFSQSFYDFFFFWCKISEEESSVSFCL